MFDHLSQRCILAIEPFKRERDDANLFFRPEKTSHRANSISLAGSKRKVKILLPLRADLGQILVGQKRGTHLGIILDRGQQIEVLILNRMLQVKRPWNNLGRSSRTKNKERCRYNGLRNGTKLHEKTLPESIDGIPDCAEGRTME